MPEKTKSDTEASAETDIAGAQSSGGTDSVNRSDIGSVSSRLNRVNQDIGADEATTRGVTADAHLYEANRKRSYDEYQDLGLQAARRGQNLYDRITNNSEDHDGALRQLSIQALQNAVTTADMVSKQAVRTSEMAMETANMEGKQTHRHGESTMETANMVGKQAARHSDIAIDRQWNVDEVSGLTAKTPVQVDAIAAAVAAAVAQALAGARKD